MMILRTTISKRLFKYIINLLYRSRCLKVKWQDIKDVDRVVLELVVKKRRPVSPNGDKRRVVKKSDGSVLSIKD